MHHTDMISTTNRWNKHSWQETVTVQTAQGTHRCTASVAERVLKQSHLQTLDHALRIKENCEGFG